MSSGRPGSKLIGDPGARFLADIPAGDRYWNGPWGRVGTAVVRLLYRTPMPVRSAYRRARSWLQRLVFERGVFDTAVTIPLEDLDLVAPDRVFYEPSGWLFLRRALHRREVTAEDVFIDFGSGLGRVLYVAARHYPFRQVVGVELSEELSGKARQNIEANRHRLACRDVEIITADVLDFPIPDDLSVAYFCNPFRGATFQHVIDGILRSVDRRPRRVRVIYAHPLEDEYLASTGRFTYVRRVRYRNFWAPTFPRAWISVWETGGQA